MLRALRIRHDQTEAWEENILVDVDSHIMSRYTSTS